MTEPKEPEAGTQDEETSADASQCDAAEANGEAPDEKDPAESDTDPTEVMEGSRDPAFQDTVAFEMPDVLRNPEDASVSEADEQAEPDGEGAADEEAPEGGFAAVAHEMRRYPILDGRRDDGTDGTSESKFDAENRALAKHVLAEPDPREACGYDDFGDRDNEPDDDNSPDSDDSSDRYDDFDDDPGGDDDLDISEDFEGSEDEPYDDLPEDDELTGDDFGELHAEAAMNAQYRAEAAVHAQAIPRDNLPDTDEDETQTEETGGEETPMSELVQEFFDALHDTVSVAEAIIQKMIKPFDGIL